MDTHRNRLATAKEVEDFVLAGNSTITLVSKRTGKHLTYRVKKPDGDDKPLFFVSLLSGPDNENSFTYLGELRLKQGNWVFNRGRKSRVNEYADSMLGWNHFWRNVQERDRIPADMEAWHEGRCGRCNRKLTDPESIERGIGPDCAEMMGL